MNREIKFRYALKHKPTGNIIKFEVSVEDIEKYDGFWWMAEMILGIGDKNLYELIGRCQYTGLKDKNGVEIYEGDIVRILYSDWISKSDGDPRTLEQYLNDIAEIKVVQWHFNGFYVSCRIGGWNEDLDYGRHGFIEVIGNIYQTPEILETKTNAI